MPFFLCSFGHSTEKPVTKEEIGSRHTWYGGKTGPRVFITVTFMYTDISCNLDVIERKMSINTLFF